MRHSIQSRTSVRSRFVCAHVAYAYNTRVRNKTKSKSKSLFEELLRKILSLSVVVKSVVQRPLCDIDGFVSIREPIMVNTRRI